MEVNPISMLRSIQQIPQTTNALDSPISSRGAGGSVNAMTESISPLGKFASGMPALNADQQADLRTFRDEMRAALSSGSFDAAEMASKAPDFVKQHAADSGISLEGAFEQLGDHVQSLRSLQSGLPFAGANGMSRGQDDLLQSLLASLDDEE